MLRLVLDLLLLAVVIFFHIFPFFLTFSGPSVVVLQVVLPRFFGFVMLDELVDVILPSFPWSSNSSVCFCLDAKTWISFCCFFVNLSSGREAILFANLHFIFLCASIQHLVIGVSCASPDFLDPFFLFDFSRVQVFVGVALEGYFAVLIASCTRAVSFV